MRDLKSVLASQSVRKEKEKKEHFSTSVTIWTTAVEARLEALERYGPDCVFVITFSQLVAETESTMRAVADWLGIAYDPVLATPTFNRLPIKANSSFEVKDFGVIRRPLESWREFFTQEEADMIDEDTRGVYERVLKVSLNGTGARAEV